MSKEYFNEVSKHTVHRYSFLTILIQEKILCKIDAPKYVKTAMENNESLSTCLIKNNVVQANILKNILQQRCSEIRLGDLLVETDLIEPIILNKALEFQKKTKEKLGDILESLGVIKLERLNEILFNQLRIYKILPEPELASDIELMPNAAYLRRNFILPYQLSQNTITIIMSDPLNYSLRNELNKFYNGNDIIIAYAHKHEILNYLNNYIIKKNNTQKSSGNVIGLELDSIEEDASIAADDSDKVEVNDILLIYIKKAFESNATDIHFEPFAKSLRIRFSIDGSLTVVTHLFGVHHRNIVSMIKAKSKMDISKNYIPGDGSLIVSYHGEQKSLRVSTYPSIYGQNCVVRIPTSKHYYDSIKSLSFTKKNKALFKNKLIKKTGIIIIAGPTGSGKTTTLYSALNMLSRKDNSHIITIEDPVEQTILGATQATINEKAGFDYPTAISSMMRQNPDVIMVGEVRDKKTAKSLLEAALTGHKVFTTIHTETAISSVSRLIDMGIEPYALLETLDLVISQRLVRKLCPTCKPLYQVSQASLLQLGIKEDSWPDNVIQSKSIIGNPNCGNCQGIGYKGRVAIHEFLQFNQHLISAFRAEKTSSELVDIAKRYCNFISLKEDAILKVYSGLTTFEEISLYLPDLSEDARNIRTLIPLGNAT